MDSLGNYIGLHLGDGHILCELMGENDLLTISSPQKKEGGNTYLTMNCSLTQCMRFYRWQERDMKKLILLTDGMDLLQKEFSSDLFTQKEQERLRQMMVSADSFDDMSYVVCEINRNQK